jgi:hypothetical protein
LSWGFRRISQDQKEGCVKRLLGIALVLVVSTPLMAATNSQTFYLSANARAANVEIPRGICEVSWEPSSGRQVQLTIRTDDKKTVTVPARRIEGRQDHTGVVTSVVNGVTYLVEFHTRDAKFIIENRTEASK